VVSVCKNKNAVTHEKAEGGYYKTDISISSSIRVVAVESSVKQL